jgi:oxygen-dependent protoporphyrinogen oxidase
MNRRVAIVGGGITGLAAAHRLGELAAESGTPLSVTVFEASDRAGGIVSTVRRGDFVFEEGPDSFITEKSEILALTRRLRLEDQLRRTRPEFRRSFVVRSGRLVPTPEGYYLLAPTRIGPVFASPLFSPLGKLRIALEPFIPRRGAGKTEDESLASFVTRRLGREALERIGQAMVGGIYGAAPENLSLEATFPRFLALERAYGSVIRGLAYTRRDATEQSSGARYGLFVTFAGGMGTLVDALVERLPAGTLRTGTKVNELRPTREGGWTVRVGDGASEPFDAVILSVPAAVSARLLGAFDPALALAMGAFSAGSSVTLSLAYRSGSIGHPLDGAGLVVPRAESPALSGLLGASFTNRKFEGRAPAGFALLRLFFGEDALGWNDDELARRGHEAMAQLIGATEVPGERHVARWPGGMPRYRVGHRGFVRAAYGAVGRHHGLVLAGNVFEGVGLPDCVRGGEAAAQKVMETLYASSSANA